MLDPEKTHELEQLRALAVETLAPLVRSFYVRLIEEGFTKAEAFTLTRDYIKTLGGNNANT